MKTNKDLEESIATTEEELARLNSEQAEDIARLQKLRREISEQARIREQIPWIFCQPMVW